MTGGCSVPRLYLNTICLPRDQDQFRDYRDNCYVAAWGKDPKTRVGKNVGQRDVAIPLVSKEKCEERLRPEFARLGLPDWKLKPSELCAGGEKGVDTCEGEGGAPLVCYDKVSVGVTSSASLSECPQYCRGWTNSSLWVSSITVWAAMTRYPPSTSTWRTPLSRTSYCPRITMRTFANKNIPWRVVHHHLSSREKVYNENDETISFPHQSNQTGQTARRLCESEPAGLNMRSPQGTYRQRSL